MTVDTYIGFSGLGLAAVSIVLALLLYYFDLKRKLEHLLANVKKVLVNQEGILTKQQAHDLIDLYLDGVEVRIELYLRRYAHNDLPRHYESGNTPAIRNEFERAYEQIVRKSLRKMVSSFRLRGNHSIGDLIENVSQEHISETMKTITGRFDQAHRNSLPLEEVIPDALLAVRRVNYAGKALIGSAIDKLYPDKADPD